MKRSELLRKQADMIDFAEKHGIDDWRKLVKIKFGGACYQVADKELYSDQQYQFALGVVEGKPVFEGDELYNVYTNIKFSANNYTEKFERFSWNPPKPKTIDVTMPIELAEYYAEYQGNRMGLVCRKALESIKQS